MKIERFYAVRVKKQGYITDARNPYEWEDVGSVIVDEESTDNEISIALDEAGISREALCVSVRHLA